jgi:D-xylonolactonase
VRIDLVADYACRNAESPMWHPLEKRLYWFDIPNGRMYSYDPVTGMHGLRYQGEVVGGFTVQADGALLLLMGQGAVRTWRREASGGDPDRVSSTTDLETLIHEVPAERHTRFKDCVADPRGRVFVGTVSTKSVPGRLYRIDLDGSVYRLYENVLGSNGMGFTPDRTRMYHTDSGRGAIYALDYDEASGAVSNRGVWVQVPSEEGVPDGLTVDAEGYVWSARWGGGCVVRHAPDGSVDRRIEFPARKVSSCIFGGEDYTDLYVTTAGGPNKAEEGHGAGAVFRVYLGDKGIRGLPEHLSRVGSDL